MLPADQNRRVCDQARNRLAQAVLLEAAPGIRAPVGQPEVPGRSGCCGIVDLAPGRQAAIGDPDRSVWCLAEQALVMERDIAAVDQDQIGQLRGGAQDLVLLVDQVAARAVADLLTKGQAEVRVEQPFGRDRDAIGSGR